MKNRIIITIVATLLSISLMGCGSSSSNSAGSKSASEASSVVEEPPFDYLAMDIYEHKYPDKFEMDDDLSQAIWSYVYMRYLACDGNLYPLDDYTSINYKSDFELFFISNACMHNSYVDGINIRGDGMIDQTRAEYIQYSLTGKYVSFDDVMKDTVFHLSDQFQVIRIRDTEVLAQKEEGDKIVLDVHLETGSDDGINATVELTKNPYSCFSGYSITSVLPELKDTKD